MDDVDFYLCTWEGNRLLSLRDGYRTTLGEKILWMEQMESVTENIRKHDCGTLRRAIEAMEKSQQPSCVSVEIERSEKRDKTQNT